MCVLNGEQIRDRGIFSTIKKGAVQPASVDMSLGAEFQWLGAEPFTLEYYETLVLEPGDFILAHTQETVYIPPDLVARVEGKSTLARKGLVVHATAGFIDPGFEGQITLEMSNVSHQPLGLTVGQFVAQLCVMRMDKAPIAPYAGKYQNSRGVVAAR